MTACRTPVAGSEHVQLIGARVSRSTPAVKHSLSSLLGRNDLFCWAAMRLTAKKLPCTGRASGWIWTPSGASAHALRWLPRPMCCAGSFRASTGISAAAALAPPQAVAAEAAERGSGCLVLGPHPLAEGLAASPDLGLQPQEGHRSSGGGSAAGSAPAQGPEPQLGPDRRVPQMDRFVGGRAAAAGAYHCRDFAWEEVRRDVEGALDAQLAALPPAAGSGRPCTKCIGSGILPCCLCRYAGRPLLYSICKVCPWLVSTSDLVISPLPDIQAQRAGWGMQAALQLI